MYRKDKYVYIINSILVVLILTSIVSSKNIEIKTETMLSKNNSLSTYLKSNYLEQKDSLDLNNEIKEKDIDEEEKISTEIKDDNNKKSTNNTVKEETKLEKETETKTEEQKNQQQEKEEQKSEVETIKKQETVLEKLVGSLAGYGPDCYGCTSFRTASGRYIGDGNIYYEDKYYGTIRIVAGDKSYPFGTIVKISGAYDGENSVIYAIVLDRGGGVGKGKQFLFDLLFKTEKEAAQAGSRKNVTFEILRLGY